MKTFAVRLLGLFVGGLLLGFVLGRHYSFDSTAPAVAYLYLGMHGRWQLFEDDSSSVVLNASPYVYSWNSRDGKVKTDLLPLNEIDATARQTKEWGEDLDNVAKGAVAVPSGALLTEMLSINRTSENKMSRPQYWILTAVTVGGVVVGYHLAHHNYPDTSNEKFIEHLKDEKVWKQINDSLRGLYDKEFGHELMQTLAEKHGLIKSGTVVSEDASIEWMKKMHPEIVLAAKTEAAKSIARVNEEQSKSPKQSVKSTRQKRVQRLRIPTGETIEH